MREHQQGTNIAHWPTRLSVVRQYYCFVCIHSGVDSDLCEHWTASPWPYACHKSNLPFSPFSFPIFKRLYLQRRWPLHIMFYGEIASNYSFCWIWHSRRRPRRYRCHSVAFCIVPSCWMLINVAVATAPTVTKLLTNLSDMIIMYTERVAEADT